MNRVFNFSPGPAMLPEEVLLQAQKEMLDWQGIGMSVMEISHRGTEFQTVMEQSEADLRELMLIPDNYKVLFIAGGASTQFAMVPINLLGKRKKADYADTGVWSHKAVLEAKHFGEINVAAEPETVDGLLCIPPQKNWKLDIEADYLHYTPNETISGLEFNWVPETGPVPLVADMTSMILSRVVNVKDFGIIYAGAQKNLGPAGMTVVIIREDLIKDAIPGTPTLYHYKSYAENESLYNTPPTYNWYLMGLVFTWTKKHGGVKAFEIINRRKAKTLYDVIDQSNGFYFNAIHPSCRSIMNVSFDLANKELTPVFLNEAEKAGLKNLRGHKVAGGVRASIYNAMPEEGVNRLAQLMVDFAKRKG